MAEIASEGMMYLHGDLELKIVKARNLPNMDLVSEHLRLCFTGCDACRPHRSAAPKDGADDKRIKHHRKIITSDPYVKVSVPHAALARTRVIPSTENPIWNQRFYIPLAHPAPNLEFEVKDNDFFGAQLIGTVLIPAEKIATGDFISGWFPVIGAYGKPPKPDTALYLEMKFTPFDKNPLYQHGIAADPDQKGVRNTSFPLRRGSSVQLYQDAHVRNDDKLPEIELDGGRIFEHGKCWEDMCHAISEAHHLIYIIGWSIYHKVRLIREPTRPLPGGGDLTLGELLKYKSEEGVRVLLLIWDDTTSRKKLFINREGVMQTHNEEIKKFFKHSSVICVLSPRYPSSKLSYIKQKACFIHYPLNCFDIKKYYSSTLHLAPLPY